MWPTSLLWIRAACPRAGVLGRRGFTVESAAMLSGMQVVVDTTFVSPLHCDGSVRPSVKVRFPSTEGRSVEIVVGLFHMQRCSGLRCIFVEPRVWGGVDGDVLLSHEMVNHLSAIAFGQFRFVQLFLLDLANFDRPAFFFFDGQFRLRPIFWMLNFGTTKCGALEGWSLEGWSLEGWSPEGWGAQNFAHERDGLTAYLSSTKLFYRYFRQLWQQFSKLYLGRAHECVLMCLLCDLI